MAPPDALPTHGAQIRSASPHTRSGSTDGTCPRSLVRVKERIAVHHMRHNVMRDTDQFGHVRHRRRTTIARHTGSLPHASGFVHIVNDKYP